MNLFNLSCMTKWKVGNQWIVTFICKETVVYKVSQHIYNICPYKLVYIFSVFWSWFKLLRYQKVLKDSNETLFGKYLSLSFFIFSLVIASPKNGTDDNALFHVSIHENSAIICITQITHGHLLCYYLFVVNVYSYSV